jgi:hypothetical protein
MLKNVHIFFLISAEVYNECMNAGLQASNDYLECWHAYIDFLRRQINFSVDSTEKTESVDSLRNTIQLAINQLYEFFKHDGDPNLTLEKYWAVLEAKYFGHMENARKIWNEMIIHKYGMNTLAQEWIDFYNFECKYGDEKHQRKVLQRALNEPIMDNKYQICELFDNFEKYNGTINSYLQAKIKVERVLLKLKKDEEKELASVQTKAKDDAGKKQQQITKAKPKAEKKPKQQDAKKPDQKLSNDLKRKVN